MEANDHAESNIQDPLERKTEKYGDVFKSLSNIIHDLIREAEVSKEEALTGLLMSSLTNAERVYRLFQRQRQSRRVTSRKHKRRPHSCMLHKVVSVRYRRVRGLAHNPAIQSHAHRNSEKLSQPKPSSSVNQQDKEIKQHPLGTTVNKSKFSQKVRFVTKTHTPLLSKPSRKFHSCCVSHPASSVVNKLVPTNTKAAEYLILKTKEMNTCILRSKPMMYLKNNRDYSDKQGDVLPTCVRDCRVEREEARSQLEGNLNNGDNFLLKDDEIKRYILRNRSQVYLKNLYKKSQLHDRKANLPNIYEIKDSIKNCPTNNRRFNPCVSKSRSQIYIKKLQQRYYRSFTDSNSNMNNKIDEKRENLIRCGKDSYRRYRHGYYDDYISLILRLREQLGITNCETDTKIKANCYSNKNQSDIVSDTKPMNPDRRPDENSSTETAKTREKLGCYAKYILLNYLKHNRSKSKSLNEKVQTKEHKQNNFILKNREIINMPSDFKFNIPNPTRKNRKYYELFWREKCINRYIYGNNSPLHSRCNSSRIKLAVSCTSCKSVTSGSAHTNLSQTQTKMSRSEKNSDTVMSTSQAFSSHLSNDLKEQLNCATIKNPQTRISSAQNVDGLKDVTKNIKGNNSFSTRRKLNVENKKTGKNRDIFSERKKINKFTVTCNPAKSLRKYPLCWIKNIPINEKESTTCTWKSFTKHKKQTPGFIKCCMKNRDFTNELKNKEFSLKISKRLDINKDGETDETAVPKKENGESPLHKNCVNQDDIREKCDENYMKSQSYKEKISVSSENNTYSSTLNNTNGNFKKNENDEVASDSLENRLCLEHDNVENNEIYQNKIKDSFLQVRRTDLSLSKRKLLSQENSNTKETREIPEQKVVSKPEKESTKLLASENLEKAEVKSLDRDFEVYNTNLLYNSFTCSQVNKINERVRQNIISKSDQIRNIQAEMRFMKSPKGNKYKPSKCLISKLRGVPPQPNWNIPRSEISEEEHRHFSSYDKNGISRAKGKSGNKEKKETRGKVFKESEVMIIPFSEKGKNSIKKSGLENARLEERNNKFTTKIAKSEIHIPSISSRTSEEKKEKLVSMVCVPALTSPARFRYSHWRRTTNPLESKRRELVEGLISHRENLRNTHCARRLNRYMTETREANHSSVALKSYTVHTTYSSNTLKLISVEKLARDFSFKNREMKNVPTLPNLKFRNCDKIQAKNELSTSKSSQIKEAATKDSFQTGISYLPQPKVDLHSGLNKSRRHGFLILRY